MRKIFWFLLLYFTFSGYLTTAQSQRNLFADSYFIDNAPAVQLKWFSPDLVYPNGVNVYRREAGTLTWFKLNKEPVKARPISMSDTQVDDEISFYYELVKSENRESLEEGFLMLNLLIKTFMSNLLSEILGIYFVDRTAEADKTYEYRVNKVLNDREALIAISQPVFTGKIKRQIEYGFEVFENNKGVSFNWEIRDNQYYGVNLYYQIPDSMNIVKINNNPVLVSMTEDSLRVLSYPNPKFLFKNVRKGETYRFWMRGVNYFGEELPPSDTIHTTIGDHEPPPVPQELTGEADSMKVNLFWIPSQSEDLNGHTVFRSRLSDGPFNEIGNCFDCSSFTDRINIPGPYYYMVAALDHSKNISYSRSIFVEVQDVIPPSQPKNLQIEPDTGRFMLSWNANLEPDLAGYYIYRTVDANDPSHYVFLNSDPIDTNYYVQEVPKITKNKFYYYVVAVDTSYNRSEPSEVASGKLPDALPPRQPFILSISDTVGGSQITWKPVLDPDLAGYVLYRADSAFTPDFQKVQETLLHRRDTTYLDTSIEPGADYLYQLVAIDSAGNASPPSTPFYYLSPASGDGADIRVSLTVNNKKRRQEARLRWETTENTDDLLGYVVYNSADTVRLRPVTGLLKTNTWTQPLSEEEDPYYQVRMYLQDGRCYQSAVMKVE